MADGRIVAVGRSLAAPAGTREVDARGRWVTPGLIDVHSHMGGAPSGGSTSQAETNEMTGPLTGQLWIEHSVWPQDPSFQAALEGGVTTVQILPGSANLVGGRAVVLRNVPGISYRDMKFPGAVAGVKMACGENPKRVYGGRNQSPATRMGSIAVLRRAFMDAQEYSLQDDPKRDPHMETLVAILDGRLPVHMHCYRADDMLAMLDVADEFGFRITAFHHAVEAYKIAGVLAGRGVCAAMWHDWWGFKMEAYDGIQENLAMVDYPSGGCSIVHSDSPMLVQRLNQEAAKGMARGWSMGMDIPPERAIGWVTSNAARALGLRERVGTLAPGFIADVVIWNGSPFSAYALTEQVYMDGVLVFDRRRRPERPRSDFMLGQSLPEASP
ncbi:amidohydrolase [Luteimonas sp. TWI662]|uniref:amidohydrolase n=1 Tax=Luteimonas sp. TWI662 TaxID=3136789 RepID=UPI003209F6F3